jgi:hypothetical protein
LPPPPPNIFRTYYIGGHGTKTRLRIKKLGYSGVEKAVICSLTLTTKHRR